jgi:hypothetical protein
LVERVRKTLFLQATLVETGAREIAKTLLRYSAGSIFTLHAIPPDPNMQGFVWIYARAEFKTLPFATKVAWGNKVLYFAFPAFFARQLFQCILCSLHALRDTPSNEFCVPCVLCATPFPMHFAFPAFFARPRFQCTLRSLRSLRDPASNAFCVPCVLCATLFRLKVAGAWNRFQSAKISLPLYCIMNPEGYQPSKKSHGGSACGPSAKKIDP